MVCHGTRCPDAAEDEPAARQTMGEVANPNNNHLKGGLLYAGRLVYSLFYHFRLIINIMHRNPAYMWRNIYVRCH
jgi:hypothetical protein